MLLIENGKKSMTLQKLKQYKIFESEKLLSLELLKNQGFCNINYLLKTSKKDYLIRKFKNDSTVNISRAYEYAIQEKAFQKDIAAQPLLLDEKNQFMVCDFLKGKHKKTINKKEIQLLAKNIKKLHKIKSNEKEYDLKKDLKNYKNILNNPEAQTSINICKKELKKLKKYKKELVTTHHDLNPKNILFHKNTIKFIDWEYVGVNDKFFDLATICFEFGLNKKEEKILLKSYQKKIDEKDMEKLHSYILIYEHLCKLWFISLNIKNIPKQK